MCIRDRHEPCFERILFVLTLDRKKMKERILIGEEQQIRFRLNGSQNAEVPVSYTHLRTFPMTKYWVPSFSVSRVPLFLLLLSFLFLSLIHI